MDLFMSECTGLRRARKLIRKFSRNLSTHAFFLSLAAASTIPLVGLTGCSSQSNQNTSTVHLGLPPGLKAATNKHQANVVATKTVSVAPNNQGSIRFATKTASTTTTPSTTTPAASPASTLPALGHLIINITGSTVGTPIFYSWDSNNGANAVPTDISFTIPRGTALFQVLGVFQDDQGALSFAYGDVLQTLAADTVPVTVNLQTLGTTSAGEGRIAGRYILADGTYPTGKVYMKYNPGNGKPSIIVTSGEVFAGWLDLFGLQGVPLDYVMDSGYLLFSGVSLDDAGVPPGPPGTTILRASIPGRCQNQDGTSNPATRVCDSVSKYEIGYFGPGNTGANSGTACYVSTGTFDSGFYVNTVDSTIATWMGTQPITNFATEGGIVAGGLSSTTTPCTQGLDLINHVTARPMLLENNDSPIGVRGPFYATVSGNNLNFLNVGSVSATGSTSITWNNAPGTALTAANQVAIFVRQGPNYVNGNADYNVDDGFACGALPALGFSYSQTVPLSANAATITGLNTSLFASNTQIVLCPYAPATGTYYTTGIDWRGSNGNGSNSSSMGYLTLSGPDSLAQTICSTYTIQGTNADGSAMAAGTTVSLSDTLNGIYNSACGGTALSGNSITLGSGGTATFGYHTSMSGITSIMAATGNALNASQDVYIYSNQNPSALSLLINSPIAAGACMQGKVYLSASGGMPGTPPQTATTVNFSSTTAAATTSRFYAGSNCNGSTITSLTIPANEVGADFSYIFSTVQANQTITATSGDLTGTSSQFQVTSPVQTSFIVQSPQTNYSPGQCVPIYVHAANSSGLPVAAANSFTSGTLAVASGTSVTGTGLLYADPTSCSNQTNGSGAENMTFNLNSDGSNAQTFYLSADGTVVVTASASGFTAGSTSFSQILPTYEFINANTQTQIVQLINNFCTPVILKALLGTTPYNLPAGTVVQVSSTDGLLSTAPNCLGGTSSVGVTMTGGIATTPFYFMASSGTSQSNFSFNAPQFAVTTLQPGVLTFADPNALRLLPTGQADPAYHVQSQAGPNGPVSAVTIDSVGRTYIGGTFTQYDYNPAYGLARLNPDGSFDTSYTGGTPSGQVNALKTDSSGNILIGGNFSLFGGVTSNNLVRLTPGGTVDTAFSAGGGSASPVLQIALDTSGNILVATSTTVVRYLHSGVVDSTFATVNATGGVINAIATDSSNRVYLGGSFTTAGGATANGIARFSTTGTHDSSFITGTGFAGAVTSIAIDSSGNIVAGGSFTTYNGSSTPKLCRLLASGSQDSSFVLPGAMTGTVTSIAIDSTSGFVYVGGLSYGASHNLLSFLPSGAINSAFQIPTSTTFATGLVSDITVWNGLVYLAGTFVW